MAKKTRRSQRKRMPAPVAKTTPAQPQPAPVSSRPAVVAKVVAPAKVDLAQEYHYVLSDLKKIAVIAAAMFALLFVLAFVLR